MSLETVELPGTKFRFVFDTSDPKELTAHLDTLDALQIHRPRRCWWAADLTLCSAKGLIATAAAQQGSDLWMDGEDSPLRFYAAAEDVDHELALLKRQHEEFFKTEVRITGVRKDSIQ